MHGVHETVRCCFKRSLQLFGQTVIRSPAPNRFRRIGVFKIGTFAEHKTLSNWSTAPTISFRSECIPKPFKMQEVELIHCIQEQLIASQEMMEVSTNSQASRDDPSNAVVVLVLPSNSSALALPSIPSIPTRPRPMPAPRLFYTTFWTSITRRAYTHHRKNLIQSAISESSGKL
jgi:hypothetical protein